MNYVGIGSKLVQERIGNDKNVEQKYTSLIQYTKGMNSCRKVLKNIKEYVGIDQMISIELDWNWIRDMCISVHGIK